MAPLTRTARLLLRCLGPEECVKAVLGEGETGLKSKRLAELGLGLDQLTLDQERVTEVGPRLRLG